MRTLCLASTLFALSGFAQPMDLYGFTPRSIAMGNTQAASDGTFAAAYFNPALLREADVGVGFSSATPSTWITALEEPTDRQQLDAKQPVDYQGATLGFTVPMRGKLRGKASIGFALYAPVRHLFRSHLLDETTAAFTRYDNGPERFQLALSLGVHPVEKLSVGVGLQVLPTIGGGAAFEAILGNRTLPGRVIQRRLDLDVVAAAAPLVGIAAGPFRGVRLYGFWRGELRTRAALPVTLELGDFGRADVSLEGTLHFAPHQAGLGASVTLLHDKLVLGLDAQWEHWSAAPAPVATIEATLPDTFAALGFNTSILSRELSAGYSDTIVPRIGAELTHRAWRFRAGYLFRPTPVPAQTGRSNFLDSHAHLASLGAGYAFDDPLEMANALHLDAAVQGTFFHTREVRKEGTSATPNFAFGGSHWLFNVALRYEL